MEDAENHSPDSAALNRTPRLQNLNVILRCLQQRASSRTMVVTAERKEEGFRMLSAVSYTHLDVYKRQR